MMSDLQSLLELIRQEQSIVEDGVDEPNTLLSYKDGLYDAYQMVIEEIERVMKDAKTPDLSPLQKRVLGELVREYQQFGGGEPFDSVEGEVLAPLIVLGLVKSTTWSGLFPARFFPTDKGILYVKENGK